MGACESLAPLGVPCLAVLAALLGSPMSEPPTQRRTFQSVDAGRTRLSMHSLPHARMGSTHARMGEEKGPRARMGEAGSDRARMGRVRE